MARSKLGAAWEILRGKHRLSGRNVIGRRKGGEEAWTGQGRAWVGWHERGCPWLYSACHEGVPSTQHSRTPPLTSRMQVGQKWWPHAVMVRRVRSSRQMGQLFRSSCCRAWTPRSPPPPASPASCRR